MSKFTFRDYESASIHDFFMAVIASKLTEEEKLQAKHMQKLMRRIPAPVHEVCVKPHIDDEIDMSSVLACMGKRQDVTIVVQIKGKFINLSNFTQIDMNKKMLVCREPLEEYYLSGEYRFIINEEGEPEFDVDSDEPYNRYVKKVLENFKY